jgi:uncharacterized membrane-anchored protein
MTLRELLGLIAPAKLERADTLALAEALHDSEGSEGPVLVRLFTAVGTWIGAAMIAVIFGALELYQFVALSLVLGAALFIGAIAWSRAPERSLIATQLIWAMALGAHGLVAGAIIEADLQSDSVMALTWTGLNLATMLLIRVPSFQLISAVCAVGFATWWAFELELPAYPLWVGVPVAVLATAAWIREVPWAARLGRTWAAIAYGLPIGALIPMTMIGLDDPEFNLSSASVGGPIASGVILALIGAVLWQAKREQGHAIDRRAYAVGVIAVLVGVATRHVPGLSLSLLWLLVAHLRKSAGLQTLASIQLGCFLFFFYYQLETTLLLKSAWVISTGVLLLIGAWLAHPRDRERDAAKPRRSRWLPAIALSLLTSGLVIAASLHKQHVLAHGQTVLLPLAPVDPRSLIQGDYMVLRYELEREINPSPIWPNLEPLADPTDPGASFDNWVEPFALQDQPRHGNLVITIDEDSVGHFARFDDGSPLADDELRLEYRLRDNQGDSLRIGAESFLFEEGTAHIYANARYGELVVAANGEAVLVGLRDEHKQPLGVRLHQP